MGSQQGKTEIGLNWIGHSLDDDPTPILYVGPTAPNLREQIEPRIMAMIVHTRSLHSKYVAGKTSTKTCKVIAGVKLRLAHSGSATEMSSDSVGRAVVDELDRMKPIKGEGSQLGMVRARTTKWPDATVLVSSTPTIGMIETEEDEHGLRRWKVAEPADVGSSTWQEWQSGTRHECATQCPECGTWFVPRFDCLRWPDGATPDEALDTACIECPEGHLIADEHRFQMINDSQYLAPGQWVEDDTVRGEPIPSRKWSFWVSGLLSPDRTFGERAAAWLEASASKDFDKMQTVINTQFGECYRVTGDAPGWKEIKQGASPYNLREVPEGANTLLMSVDVQEDRLVYELRGWGEGLTSWLIEADEFAGDTDRRNVWRRLEQFIQEPYAGLPIYAVGIDSGFRTDPVYRFCERHPNAHAIKGANKAAKLYARRKVSKGSRRGYAFWFCDTTHWKAWVHARLKFEPDESGAWNVPTDTTDQYAKELVAEQQVQTANGETRWIQVSKHNHFLDTAWMNAALAHILRIADLRPARKQKPKPKAAPPGNSWVGARTNWMDG